MSGQRRFAWDEGIGDLDYARWIAPVGVTSVLVKAEANATNHHRLPARWDAALPQPTPFSLINTVDASAEPLLDLFSRATAESEAASSRALARILALTVPLSAAAAAQTAHSPSAAAHAHAPARIYLPPQPPLPRDHATLLVDAEAVAIRARVRMRSSGGGTLPPPPLPVSRGVSVSDNLSAEERADRSIIIDPLRRLLRGEITVPVALPPRQPPPQVLTTATAERSPAVVVSNLVRNFHGFLSGRELLQQAELLARYSDKNATNPEGRSSLDLGMSSLDLDLYIATTVALAANAGSTSTNASTNSSIANDTSIGRASLTSEAPTMTTPSVARAVILVAPPRSAIPAPLGSRIGIGIGTGIATPAAAATVKPAAALDASYIPRPRSKVDWALAPGSWKMAAQGTSLGGKLAAQGTGLSCASSGGAQRLKAPAPPAVPHRAACFDLGDGDEDVSLLMQQPPSAVAVTVAVVGAKALTRPIAATPGPAPVPAVSAPPNRGPWPRVKAQARAQALRPASRPSAALRRASAAAPPLASTTVLRASPILAHPLQGGEVSLHGRSDFVPLHFDSSDTGPREPMSEPTSEPTSSSRRAHRPLSPPPAPRPTASPAPSSASRSRLFESSMRVSDAEIMIGVGGVAASPTFLRLLRGLDNNESSDPSGLAASPPARARRLFSGGDESP